jgi:hypothetical protein
MDGVSAPGENIYLPLIMALQWSAAHAAEVNLRPGPEWVQTFFKDLSGTDIPAPHLPGRTVEL